MLGPHHSTAFAAVAVDDGWPRADNACTQPFGVTPPHMLVEKFHDSVGKGVSGRIAEIIFRDWAVAVRRLRRAVHGLAAGEELLGIQRMLARACRRYVADGQHGNIDAARVSLVQCPL